MALSRSTKRKILRGTATAAIISTLGFGGVAGFKAFKVHQAETKVQAVQVLSKAGVRTPEQWFNFKKENELQLNPRRKKDQQTIVIIDHISKRTGIPAENVAKTILGIRYSHPPMGKGIDGYMGDIRTQINRQNLKLAGAKRKVERKRIEDELKKLHNLLRICEEVQKLPGKFQPFVYDYAMRGAADSNR